MSDKEYIDVKSSSVSEDVIETEAPISSVNEKKMFRKVDYHVLTIMLVTYGLQFMDKLSLSSGSVFGIRTDLGMKGQDYSWTSSIFYFGYLFGDFFVTRIVQIVPLGKFISITVFLWAVVLTASAGCQTTGGLLAARFFLGLLESAVSPTFVFMTSMWWKRKQQPSRTGLWFAGTDIGGIVSNFASYGLGHIGGKLSPWRYIFIVYGGATLLWSIVMFFFLPDSPETAHFLNSDEKEFYRQNMQQSKVETKWNWDQVKETAIDVNVWLLLASTVLCILPNSGMLSYGFIILESFKFKAIDTTLFNVPGSVISWISISSTGIIASRFKNQRCHMMIVVILLSIIGGTLCYKGQSKGVKLVGYYFLQTQPAIFPLILSIAASNFRGTTRRTLVNCSIFVIYCACNIGGPQLFRASDAPLYSNAFRSWIICYCLNIGAAVAIIFKYRWDNKKQSEKDQTIEFSQDCDLAEFNDPTFRYLY